MPAAAEIAPPQLTAMDLSVDRQFEAARESKDATDEADYVSAETPGAGKQSIRARRADALADAGAAVRAGTEDGDRPVRRL